MWIVNNKPELYEALGDIDPLVDHCRSLNNSHIEPLKKLYIAYHKKGYATTNELSPLDEVKDEIKKQYTYKMTGGESLGYVRQKLNSNVTQCPMCSINETHQLDHFMNEGTYGQLACCRLNLVPTCGVCNRLKHDNPYSDFVHAYYDKYPDVDFFVTTITVRNNHLGMIFSIDGAAIGNPVLARKTQTQFTHLELKGRLHKAGIAFVNNMIGGLMCTTDKELQDQLMSSEKYYKEIYGRNDWRTSIIRGLRANAAFNINVVNAMRIPVGVRRINGGGA